MPESRCACYQQSVVSRLFIAVLLGAVVCAGSGCVRRRLTVRTNPPGAQVFVDDQEIGTTPCSASFVYYGTRKITLVKDGYRIETIFQKLNPPWYQIPPLDFVSENLNPQEVRDERIVDVQLIPEETVPAQKLIERAQSLRESGSTGMVTPLLGAGALPQRPAEHIGYPGQGLPGSEPLRYESLPAPAAPASPFRP